MISALKIHVSGVVQGVGFRPFVYRQAKLNLINGWVLNSADGVHIHAEGEDNHLDEFCLALANDAPAAAKVQEVEMKEVPLEGFTAFEIRHSMGEKTSAAGTLAGQTLISPDLATCNDCVCELFDKINRRYRYPFINCTNCGPRFTIIGQLPYDRCYTSMCTFKMCDICDGEYHNPDDRRFHAQPNACFECGPHITWIESEKLKRSKRTGFQGAGAGPLGSLFFGDSLKHSDEIFKQCVNFLLDGKIVAIKGLGGFHLTCDATNSNAVATLRKRKLRSNKAFAIMAVSIEAVKEICRVNKTEESLLTGSARPIVLLPVHNSDNEIEQIATIGESNVEQNHKSISPEVAMGLPEIGVMLPYTPVQHILMHDFAKAGGKYLVMTSGNIYDNPIVTDDDCAYEILRDVADAFLGNDREILERYDDSVVRVIDAAGTEAIQMIRRARGYAPSPLKISFGKNENKEITANHKQNMQRAAVPFQALAVGPEQKNTFAFAREVAGSDEVEVFVSQHIGDVENAEIFETWEKTKNQYEQIFKLKPRKIYCDVHPEYLTTKWAQNQKLPVESVQHHFAHIRSVMYENNLDGPVAGFAFDGTGFGADGHIWGGEALICNITNFERFANFTYVPMPGGVSAIKNPLQMAYGALWAFDLLEHPALKKIKDFPQTNNAENLNSMIEAGINTPMTSSVGRLFDAASALLGICPNPTYEGEAAIMLEAKLWDYIRQNPKKEICAPNKNYEIQLTKNVATDKSTAQDTSVVLFDASSAFTSLLDDIESGIEVGQISKNFHDAFVFALLNCAVLIRNLYDINQVALSGGVFMNRYLIENSIKALIEEGFSVALNHEVPPNDGGLSLGQL